MSLVVGQTSQNSFFSFASSEIRWTESLKKNLKTKKNENFPTYLCVTSERLDAAAVNMLQRSAAHFIKLLY